MYECGECESAPASYKVDGVAELEDRDQQVFVTLCERCARAYEMLFSKYQELCDDPDVSESREMYVRDEIEKWTGLIVWYMPVPLGESADAQ